MGEFYNKDKGARFVLKYAAQFPKGAINAIEFEKMVEIFDQFGNETKRVYDFVIDGKKYELKAWTKWAPWSDEVFLNQFVKDIASIGDLENLQWVFMKTENITEESLHKYIIRTLKSQKGRNELIRYLKLEQTKALFGFPKKIEDSNELVENIIKHFENKEKFYTLFKVVE